ncbi:YbjN domain-containing protein [Schaalia vaccimaxillae]|uniref:YbjN domain-containing protein n=1 Tax=Schaalia vaccimaxillae TaxID=183916 RepID=UPI0003B44E45|nr:YbjN domain-containing protein [Schaalia vaccimaxillae]
MAAPCPLSTERIREMLTDRNVHFGEYEAGELACPARNAVYFWNATNPQILQLRAQWRGIATDNVQFSALVDEVAHCNATRTGPKAYLAPFEDGQRYGLIAESNLVTISGVTQKQLDNFFETSMSMIMGFFADLEHSLPSFVDWAAEDEAGAAFGEEN